MSDGKNSVDEAMRRREQDAFDAEGRAIASRLAGTDKPPDRSRGSGLGGCLFLIFFPIAMPFFIIKGLITEPLRTIGKFNIMYSLFFLSVPILALMNIVLPGFNFNFVYRRLGFDSIIVFTIFILCYMLTIAFRPLVIPVIGYAAYALILDRASIEWDYVFYSLVAGAVLNFLIHAPLKKEGFLVEMVEDAKSNFSMLR